MSRPAHTDAFIRLLEKCLSAGPSDQLAIVYDERFAADYLPALTSAVVDREIHTTFLMIPEAQQLAFCDRQLRSEDEIRLPTPFEEAVHNANRILNVLSGSTKTLPVRKAVLAIPRLKDCRFAHVPGLSDEILRLAEVSPFDTILEHSELVAWALGFATDATLVSCDAAGQEYRLQMSLGGWKNEPLMSPGLLLPGSWGNLPPGESFCCPDPAYVAGEVCISGSVPGYVLRPGDEVVLTFEQGRLTSWRSHRASPASEFFERERARAATRGDNDWNLFAELGVGLNPAIPALTGNSLYDEKVAGTVHIAIGDNRSFGHDNSSSLHADLAILQPTLYLGSEELIKRGELALDRLETRRRNWRPAARNYAPKTRLSLKAEEVLEEAGELMRRLCKAERIGHVRMGDPAVGNSLALVARHLQETDGISVAALRKGLPSDLANSLEFYLAILEEFDCLTVR